MDQLNVRLHAVWPAMAILIAVALLASPPLASASSDALLVVALPQSTCSYTVRAGNTLFSIAARYNTTVYYLTQLNVLNNPNRIYAGMMLRVPCNGVSNPRLR
jgi:nucleoid-associated protein YgaU